MPTVREKQFLFLIIWKSDESDEKPSTSQPGKHIPMFSDVSKAHETASVCDPFYWFSSNIYKRSVFIKMLVEKFSRDITDHRTVEVRKASSWKDSY